MANDIEQLRASMRSAQVFGKGQYVEEGRHLLEIKLLKYNRTIMEGAAKESYIAEFIVVESSNPSHEVGSTRTYIENPANAGWLGRFKAFLLAAAGIDPNGKVSVQDEDTIGDMFAALRYDEFRASKQWPENFMAGRRVKCEGMPGKSKKGGAITNKNWSPVAQ